MTGRAKKKSASVSELAKRRHVRTAQWRLPVGDADVAALAVSVLQAEMLVKGMEITRESKPVAQRAGYDAQVALAQERLTDAQNALEAASEVVTFTEVPHDESEALRLAERTRFWAALAAASSDLDGDVDAWEALMAPLPLGDHNALLEALQTANGLNAPSLGKGR